MSNAATGEWRSFVGVPHVETDATFHGERISGECLTHGETHISRCSWLGLHLGAGDVLAIHQGCSVDDLLGLPKDFASWGWQGLLSTQT